MIPDINYHMTPRCNMSCRYCFAHFKGVSELKRSESIYLVQRIADYGFRKINFVGGEPTLVPWLKKALKEAHNYGLITSIITNGWTIERNWLDEHARYLDWIGISIDSLSPNTNKKLGRKVHGVQIPDYNSYLDSIDLIREYEVKLKINTVVNRLNKNESFHNLITRCHPEKWKIFQVLIIKNENMNALDLSVSRNEFNSFILRHSDLSIVTEIYPEYSDDMMGSYLIIDPSGRLVDNSQGNYQYSDCILDIGFLKAMEQVRVSSEKYQRRQTPRIFQNISTETISERR